MAEQENGLYVTSRTVSAVLGVIALGVAIFSGVSAVNSYSFRLSKLESDQIRLLTTINDLNTKLDTLNVKIVDLTIILNRVQDRYETLQPASR